MVVLSGTCAAAAAAAAAAGGANAAAAAALLSNAAGAAIVVVRMRTLCTAAVCSFLAWHVRCRDAETSRQHLFL
jgi:fucose permease